MKPKQSLSRIIANCDYKDAIEFYDDVKLYANRIATLRVKYNIRNRCQLILLESDLRFYPFTFLSNSELHKKALEDTKYRLQQHLPKNNAHATRN